MGVITEKLKNNVKKIIKGIREKIKIKNKKVTLGIVISVCTLLVIYFGMVVYYTKHFHYGTAINCISVSGKTVEEAKQQMELKLQEYTLSLNGRDEKAEQIKAADIGLRYNSEEYAEKLKENQNPFGWIAAFFNSEDSQVTEGVTYDEKLLDMQLDKLSYFDSKNIIEPKNPTFNYTDNGFVIVEEVYGNKIDKNILKEQVVNAIIKEKVSLDLEEANCYVNPQYTSKSDKIIDINNKLNKYAASKISYNFGSNKEVIDGSIINKWLQVNENLEITFDESKAKEHLAEVLKKYNTIGKARSFVTSSGKTIQVSGGDYGWAINNSKEQEELIAAIKEGQTITKDPTYTQTAFAQGNSDIGNTYVEIDISSQHLWFYKNGNLITHGSIVTGNVSQKHSTPGGVYRLKYKQRNTVLRGQGYAAPVSFWMPFNGGIGMHDASWRSSFGGSIYRTNGSHGCVNCPYNLAKAIYENITEGTPIICYY